LAECISVFGFFGDWLAEMERLAGDGVDGEFQVVGGDGACDIGGKRENSFNCFRSRGVFENDSEVGERVSDLGQVSKEMFLGIEDGDVLEVRTRQELFILETMTYLLVIAWYLTVKVENHTLLLHRLEHGVIDLIVLNPGSRVGSHTPRVRLDSCFISPTRSCTQLREQNVPLTPALAAFLISCGVTSG
jgi:hypothetical protein